MSKASNADYSADMAGFGRLTTAAVAGVTDVVEAVHRQIACPFGGLAAPSAERLTPGISGLVYNSIRGVNRLVELGFAASASLSPASPTKVSPRREAIVAALNGVVGDYLVKTNNPLAISMSLRRHGRRLEIERHSLQAAIRNVSGKVLLLVHGLCLNDLQLRGNGRDLGAALSRKFGYSPLYLHYNTGLHISENGQSLATLLETLVEQWPVPVEELAIIGHSMGGLVSRSAHHYGTAAGHQWPAYLRRIIFLGTPHHGAPLERLGNWVDTALEVSPYSAPFARLGKIRSAGITDMRHGTLLEEDWKGRDRFEHSQDLRTPVSLPIGVQCCAIAATKHEATGAASLDLFGDGLVPVNSALGRHRDPAMSLELKEAHRWIGYGMSHWDLLSRPAVYDRIRSWFGESPEYYRAMRNSE
jgi:pimeloyl-ACP methyl ester carboxylesterase